MNARLAAAALAHGALSPTRGYELLGGCVSGDELASLMSGRWPQPISRVARMLVDRQVVRFDHGGGARIPLFQFDRNLDVQADVQAVLAELEGVLDDEEIATWFATPNASIGFQAPAVLVARGDHAVLGAARAERFLARWA